jgi:hypothetical protein
MDSAIPLTPEARRALDAMFPPDPLARERAVYERAVAEEQAAHRAAFGDPVSISRHEAHKIAREEHSHGRRKLTRRLRTARKASG